MGVRLPDRFRRRPPTRSVAMAAPKIGNIFSRLLYAIRFGSDQILFSNRVNSESQILYDRSPKERVAKVAPYLTLDGRVYPAVVMVVSSGSGRWLHHV